MAVQLVPRWAEVSVSSDPPGATIYAGGRGRRNDAGRRRIARRQAPAQCRRRRVQGVGRQRDRRGEHGTDPAAYRARRGRCALAREHDSARGQRSRQWTVSRPVADHARSLARYRLPDRPFKGRLRIHDPTGPARFGGQRIDHGRSVRHGSGGSRSTSSRPMHRLWSTAASAVPARQR